MTPDNRALSLLLQGEGGPLAVDEVLKTRMLAMEYGFSEQGCPFSTVKIAENRHHPIPTRSVIKPSP